MPDAPYFTLAELRAFSVDLADPVRYPDAALNDMRPIVEQSLEDACGVAFVPRTSTRQAIAAGALLDPGVRRVRSVTSVTDYLGATVDLTDTWVQGDYLTRATQWPKRVLTVVVQHGYDAPPLRVKGAAMLLAKNWLIKGPLDDRTTSLSTEDGTFALATPGLRGSEFGLSEVDRVVVRYRDPVVV